MGRYIIKGSKEADVYGEYSTVVDAFVSVGTYTQYLAGGIDIKRLTRADQYGSSVLDTDSGRWDDEWIMIREGVSRPRTSKNPSRFWLKRDDVAAYLQFILNKDETQAEALLVERDWE